MVRVARLVDDPILHPGSHPTAGHNIQGPSLIRVPSWISEPLGRYYLYFADHKGDSIRLAHADELAGPWNVHPPGTLQLTESLFLSEPPHLDDQQYQQIEALYREALGDTFPPDLRTDLVHPHIASPDVHIDADTGTIILYFHGLEAVGVQQTRAAVSKDGLSFEVLPELLGPSYFRVFRYGGYSYALAMPGEIRRSADGLSGFEKGPVLFDQSMRHSAVRVVGDVLEIYWTRVGDAPERIYRSIVDLGPDWLEWCESEPVEVLRGERTWEGADLPAAPSHRGAVVGRVNQLRDPAVYEEDGRVFLLYAVAGESGIAIAEVLV